MRMGLSIAKWRQRSFRPRDLSGIKLWLRSDLGLVGAAAIGTPSSSGTAPPAISFTGTPLGLYNLRYEILVGGALGTASGRVSLDGGATYPLTGVVTGASVALTGTGLTMVNSVGTYATDNVYLANTTIATWQDQSGLANNGTATGTPEYIIRSATMSQRPVVRLSGVTQRFNVVAAGLGITGAFTVFAVFVTTGSSADAGIFGNGVSKHFALTHNSGATVYLKVGGAANNVSTSLALNTKAIIGASWDGTTGANSLAIRKNGALIQQAASTLTPSDASAYFVGLEPANTYLAGDLAEIIVCNRKLTAVETNRVESYLLRRYP